MQLHTFAQYNVFHGSFVPCSRTNKKNHPMMDAALLLSDTYFLESCSPVYLSNLLHYC